MKPQLDHSLFLVGLLGVLVLTIPVVGPAFESFVFPVITDAKVIQQTREDDLAVFVVHGTRHRPECNLRVSHPNQPVQIPAVIALVTDPWSAPEARLVQTPFGKTGNSVNRPPGTQSLGAWKVSAPVGAEVEFVIKYTCHALWTTTVSLGPWQVIR